jgi:2-polyprenyl-3-methyl-5-hydroxy-6-metoxy-1,4-benzoquinol methylase
MASLSSKTTSTTASGDLFAFGGSEADVRRIQAPLARRFGPDDVVADLGCGRGIFLQLLQERGVQAIGVDLADQASVQCAQRGLTNVVQADVLTFLAGRPGAFSGIFCSQLIEHLAPEHARRLIDLCHDALRPRGQLIIVTPNAADLGVIGETFWLDPTHVRPYPLPLLRNWLAQARFEVIEARTTSGVPLWSGGRRHFLRRLWLKLLLGPHFWAANSLIIGRKL